MDSTYGVPSEAGNFHVAIIMDGNGRWATRRGLPRAEGHRAGAGRIRQIVQAAPALDVGTLTLYAFSGSNWARPESEVLGLMKLFEDFFRAETDKWQWEKVRASVIGRRDRLPPQLLDSIEVAERATRTGERLHLRLAIDYSGQDVIMEAAQYFPGQRSHTREDFARLMALASHADPEDPNVDLVIRTGGEQRLSDFLLWELAYAELWFSSKLWPDFTAHDLATAIGSFRSRERRYGHLKARQSETPLLSRPVLALTRR